MWVRICYGNWYRHLLNDLWPVRDDIDEMAGMSTYELEE